MQRSGKLAGTNGNEILNFTLRDQHTREIVEIFVISHSTVSKRFHQFRMVSKTTVWIPYE